MMGAYPTRSADEPPCWATSGEVPAETGRGFVHLACFFQMWYNRTALHLFWFMV